MIAGRKSRKIPCAACAYGRRHDFRLFKDSRARMRADTQCQAGTGYQGMAKLHANSLPPKKRGRKYPLSEQDRKRNHVISSSRCLVENIIRDPKIFRILAEKYRNRRRRFGLRFNLIAALCNLNLSHA